MPTHDSGRVDELHHLVHAGRVAELYQCHAAAWASDRGTHLIEKAWLDRFRNLLPDRAHILDIGCGSGEPIARYLISQGHSVTGIDSSPAMIAMARTNDPSGRYCVADMRTLDHSRTYAGILAWDSFFHLCHDDQRRMFPIFRKHAPPGAALMFTSGVSHGVAIGSYRNEPLYHASLDAAEYRSLLAGHGFEVVSHVVEDPDCGGRTVWLAQLR